MSNAASSRRPSETLDHVVHVCDRFEAAWRAGPRPAIESFLPAEPDDLRREVLRELVVVELELRTVAGEKPDPAEYHRRFPELTDGSTALWDGAIRDTPFTSGPAAGDVLGPYELLEALGAGGMGVVFKARHRVTGGDVAVKVIRPDVFDGDPAVRAEAVRRFTHEFRTQATIRHPHALPVYDVGESDGRPYYAMPYVAGASLAQAVRERPLAVRHAAEAIACVAEAAEAAHQAGVLHRDIKPHNVLLDPAGRAYLADFGLAKRLEAFRSRAAPSVAMIGTLPYAAPEQVRGADELDRRADVYGLGATLYAALTGRPPFQTASAEETLHQVLTADPAPPRVLNPAVPRDLEVVCLKCLRKDPRDRYPTAADLAADLRRFLDNKPVLARPLPVWRRAGRWAGRHPRQVSAFAAAAVCLAVLVGAIIWQRDRDRSARAESAVAALRQSDDAQARELIATLVRDPRASVPPLTDAWTAADPDGPDRVRLAAAYVAVAPADRSAEHARFLEGRIADAGPHTLRIIRDALAKNADELRPRLWDVVSDEEVAIGHRFRAAAVLAAWDPDDERWAGNAGYLTRHLLSESPALVAAWVELFRPAERHLRGRLTEQFHDRGRPDRAQLAAAVLAEWLTNPADLPLVVELTETADSTQFTYLWPRLRDRREAALTSLRARLVDADRANDAGRRANLAAAVLRLDPADTTTWERLTPTDPADPTPGLLLHRLAAFGIGPHDLARQLDTATDPGFRQALVLALGEIPAADQSPRQQRVYADRLRALYRTDPDPGIHAAADWTLRAWGVDPGPPGPGPASGDAARWIVTPSGLTMTTFVVPVLVTTAAGTRRTLAPFSLATRETTLGEFRRFQAGYRPSERRNNKSRDADDEAVSAVTFFEAARYCNWLSKLEGLGDDDLCYEDRGKEIVPRPDFERRRGYRLPTEAEWDYGCRGQLPCRRFFGNADELVGRYGWYKEATDWYPMPPGKLKPNRFGLFDVLGNMHEWCHRDGGPGPDGQQVRRGQGLDTLTRVCNGEDRIEQTPDWPIGSSGFRVARTLLARPPGE
jgi:serine/threonine protein kinase